MKTFLLAAVLGWASLLAGCSSFLSSDGPYLGRVIDRKSKRPVEGAVVLAIWPRESSSITKQTLWPRDVKEALTDKEGNFTLAGTSKFSFDPMVRIKEPMFTIFKPGYETIEQRKLLPLEKEQRIVLQLRELTTKEERLQNLRRLSFANCRRVNKKSLAAGSSSFVLLEPLSSKSDEKRELIGFSISLAFFLRISKNNIRRPLRLAADHHRLGALLEGFFTSFALRPLGHT